MLMLVCSKPASWRGESIRRIVPLANMFIERPMTHRTSNTLSGSPLQSGRGWTVGHAQCGCCTQKSVLSGVRACALVHAVHSMNSKRPGDGAWPTTEARPKFCWVIPCQQRLQTGGLACNCVPPVGEEGWYAISPTRLIGIVFSKRWRQDPQSWHTARFGGALLPHVGGPLSMSDDEEYRRRHWTVS
jgi:hypothetical protein